MSQAITRRVFIIFAFLFLGLMAASAPAFADWEQGMKLFESKDFAGAQSEFEGVIAQNPEHPAGYYMSALCLIQLNKVDEAIEALKKTVQLEPKHYDANYKLALFQMKKGRTAEVIQASTAALENTTKDGEKGLCLKLRGAAYLKNNKSAEAKADLDQAIQLLPNDPGLSYLAGVASLKTKDFADAFEKLSKASAAEPTNKEYTRHLMEAASLSGNYEKTREIGEGLGDQRSSEATELLGAAYLALKDFPKAATTFESLPDSNKDKLYNLAQSHMGAKNWAKAEATLKAWQEKSPNELKTFELLGLVYENLHKPKDALAQYQKGKELAGGDKFDKMIDRAQLAIKHAEAAAAPPPPAEEEAPPAEQ
ncbi:MAG: tetratricopeptide repeat protein [Candidatus Schekmanbacteria bacterium]|nr:tetratricopeptide repeat protein [Candidatus Schekmanbacteria bacterium]